jgi:uncharacterized protein YdeI (YjbR/CyaY-like superfamily)
MPTKDKRIDAYIEKAQPFAKPILSHLRELVHKGCPDCEETLKWGMPSFVYNAKILAGMASFKQHAAFGFWNQKLMADPHNLFEAPDTAMGSIGRLEDISDLPKDRIVLAYIRESMRVIDSGEKRAPKHPPREKKELVAPDYLTKALKKNAAARKHFELFSPSKKKDYIEWLTEAKTEATREKRLEQALEWIAEGKSRNWKYERAK